MVTLKTNRWPSEPVNSTEGIQPVGNRLTEEPQAMDDDRSSSSLSEIEDGLVEEPAQDPTERQTDNESEAETERLEPSPEKPRERRDVILGSETGHRNEDAEEPESTMEGLSIPISEPDIADAAKIPLLDEDPSTSLTSLGPGDTGIEQVMAPPETPPPDNIASPHHLPSPIEIAGQKRKLQDISGDGSGSGSGSEDREAGEPLAKRTGAIRTEIAIEGGQERLQVVETITRVEVYEGTSPKNVQAQAEVASVIEQAVIAQKESPSRRGRRKVAQNQTSELKVVESVAPVSEALDREMVDVGDVQTPQVDAEADDDEEDVDTPAKNEEGILKKRDAMEILSLIEKQFATFRDKLYEERLAQLDNEIAQLAQPNPTHPEYLAKVQCIKARRDEKVRHEQILFRYKMQALERNLVGTRSQILSEFYQTVRDLREMELTKAGEHWYQIQRDRREWEKAVPDFTVKFPTRRSQQVAQQTAYNTEVSVLSGIAKHVGFPAAPEIEGARPSEIETDLAAMGISSQS